MAQNHSGSIVEYSARRLIGRQKHVEVSLAGWCEVYHTPHDGSGIVRWRLPPESDQRCVFSAQHPTPLHNLTFAVRMQSRLSMCTWPGTCLTDWGGAGTLETAPALVDEIFICAGGASVNLACRLWAFVRIAEHKH